MGTVCKTHFTQRPLACLLSMGKIDIYLWERAPISGGFIKVGWFPGKVFYSLCSGTKSTSLWSIALHTLITTPRSNTTSLSLSMSPWGAFHSSSSHSSSSEYVYVCVCVSRVCVSCFPQNISGHGHLTCRPQLNQTQGARPCSEQC